MEFLVSHWSNLVHWERGESKLYDKDGSLIHLVQSEVPSLSWFNVCINGVIIKTSGYSNISLTNSDNNSGIFQSLQLELSSLKLSLV